MINYDFQPGDRIRYIGSEDLWKLNAGELGTFLGYYKENSAVALIEWDRRSDTFHNNNGIGRDNHCWNVLAKSIKLIESIDSVGAIDIEELL